MITMFRLSMTQPHQCAYMDFINVPRLSWRLESPKCIVCLSFRHLSHFVSHLIVRLFAHSLFDFAYLWWDCVAIALACKQTRYKFAMLCLFNFKYVVYKQIYRGLFSCNLKRWFNFFVYAQLVMWLFIFPDFMLISEEQFIQTNDDWSIDCLNWQSAYGGSPGRFVVNMLWFNRRNYSFII
jgi:hypothetical protein